MLRYCVNLVLFTTAVVCGRQIMQRLQSVETPPAVEATALDPVEQTISAAEAWRRYHEEVRRGIVCDEDVPPHPAVVAAVMAIVSLRVLTKPLRRTLAA